MNNMNEKNFLKQIKISDPLPWNILLIFDQNSSQLKRIINHLEPSEKLILENKKKF
jgi:hypothetical protein